MREPNETLNTELAVLQEKLNEAYDKLYDLCSRVYHFDQAGFAMFRHKGDPEYKKRYGMQSQYMKEFASETRIWMDKNKIFTFEQQREIRSRSIYRPNENS